MERDDGRSDDRRYITGAPRVFNGKVIIGHGGADSARHAAMSRPMTRDRQAAVALPHGAGRPSAGFENPAMKMAAKT